MWVAFANVNAKATHIFFSKNISIYAIFNGQSFNDMLPNDTVSFEELGPGCFAFHWFVVCVLSVRVSLLLVSLGGYDLWLFLDTYTVFQLQGW